jgi:hypothetical protein
VRTARALEAFGPLFGRNRTRAFVRDLVVLLGMASWARRPRRSYMGDPARADAATGEQLLDLLGLEVATILDDVASGRRSPEDLDPLAWRLRWLLELPGNFPWVGDAPT